MDRSPWLHPVGPEPARVYWLRRAAVLVVLATAVALAVVAIGGSGGNSPAPSAAPSSGPSHPNPSPTTRVVSDCSPSALTVVASADAATYPAGVSPRFSVVVRNVSGQVCQVLTAPAARTWTIRSGTDRVWSSADCTLAGGLSHRRLRPGHTISYSMSWDRHRSAHGCPQGQAEAGPGTYRLSVQVSGATAAPVIFHLTT